MNIAKFREWLDRCVQDAETELHLSSEQIALILTQKLEELILAELIRKKEKKD